MKYEILGAGWGEEHRKETNDGEQESGHEEQITPLLPTSQEEHVETSELPTLVHLEEEEPREQREQTELPNTGSVEPPLLPREEPIQPSTLDVKGEKSPLEQAAVENRNRDCNLTNKFCTTHGQKLDSMKVTKRIWKDRGKGKGFGYVSTKITKYFCNPRTRDLKTSNFSDVESVSQSQEDKLGGLIRK